ncbi:MAG: GntR family transcriptional regulator, partial [Hydrogenophaga sp.]
MAAHGMNTTPDTPGGGWTLRARVREALRERILRGEWQTHERLPSENQLIEEQGVSRIT